MARLSMTRWSITTMPKIMPKIQTLSPALRGMTWHYRILRHPDGTLALHETFCDAEDRMTSYTARPVSFVVYADEGREALIQSLQRALRDAIERPILDIPDVPEVAEVEFPSKGRFVFDASR